MRRTAVAFAVAALGALPGAGCDFDQARQAYCQHAGRCAVASSVDHPAQVRQGATGISLVVHGQHLSGATGAELLPAGVGTVEIASPQSDDQLQLTATIHHGVTPGTLAELVIRYEREEDTQRLVDLFEVGPIVVSSTAGTESGAGTLASPLRTLSQAAAVAESGDLILLQPGTYLDAWPESLAGSGLTSTTLKSGVRVRGNGATEEDVTLEPRTDQTTHAAFHVRDAAITVENLTIRRFHRGVVVADGAVVSLNDVRIDAAADLGLYVTGTGNLAAATGISVNDSRNAGLWVEATGTATLRNSSVFRSYLNGLRVTNSAVVRLEAVTVNSHGRLGTEDLDHCGVHIDSSAQLTLVGGTVNSNYFCGIVVEDSAQLTLQGTEVASNGLVSGSIGQSASGLVMLGGTAAIDGATIRQNQAHGIATLGGSPGLTIRGGRTTIESHSSGAGLYLAGVGPQVSLRNVEFVNNYNGIVVHDAGAFEAGDATVEGNNSFSSTNFDISDQRPALTEANGVVLSFSRTTLKSGLEPVPRTYTGVFTDPGGQFHISGLFQRIVFHAL
jgi:parallel beta-helix repeat protein